MKFESIAEIYAANDDVHGDLKSLVSTISEEAARTPIDGEKWTIAQIVEHIAMVDDGGARICSKLLGKLEVAAAASVAGSVTVSDNFLKHYSTINEVKLVAPDRVQPSGTISIAQSIAQMDENRARLGELQPRFEASNSDATFPHPYFGELSAIEWLILVGGHKQRHANQIRKLLERLN
jgi:hypothetical protein